MLEQLGRRQRGGNPHVVAFERRFVRIHAVEQERLRVGFVRQPARQRERRMQMAVDETGRRHGAAAVNHLLAGEPLRDLGRLVDGDDLALVYCDRCVANDAALGIDRDQPIDIGDEQVDGLHAGLRRSVPAVMRGLDPRIHLLTKTDGLPGQARQ